MGVYKDTLITKILMDSTQATQELSKFMSIGSQMGKLAGAGGDVNYQMKQLETGLGKNSMAFKLLNSQYEEGITKAKELKNRFDMNNLSWLFGGMMMQRMGMSIMRFVIPSMDKLEKLNTAGAKKVMGLSAAFEFLKVSIFETLANTPLFENFIKFLIDAAINLAEFTQKHPTVVSMAAAFGAIATAVGGFMIAKSFIGQMTHIGRLVGLSDKEGLWLGFTGVSNKIKGIGTALGKWAISHPFLATLAVVAALATAAVLKFDHLKEAASEIYDDSVAGPFESVIAATYRLTGAEIDAEEAWEALGSTAIWVLSFIGTGANLAAQGITTLFNWVHQLDLQLSKGWQSAKGLFASLTGNDEMGIEAADKWAELDAKQKKDALAALEDYNKNEEDFEELTEKFRKGPLGFMEDGDSKQVSKTKEIMAETNEEINNMIESSKGAGNAILDYIGDLETEGTAIHSMNALGTEITDDNTYFNKLAGEMEIWANTKLEKHVYIYYHKKGHTDELGQGMCQADFDDNVGSLTGG